ncbi:MAG: hypothetical protein KDC84_12595 [Crocinitomicaceae bacterium]|nr:hypothetical protein [Crocinitomicaceae bacterium]
MSKYFSLITSTIIGLGIGVAIFYWGWVNEGYIRMIIGGLIGLAMIKSGIDNYNYIVELEKWISENQNSFILFYPTKKETQETIKETLIPNIDFEFKEVFYDGPKLIGDIKRSIVLELMNWNTRIRVNEPAMLYVRNRSIDILELKELLEIKSENFVVDKTIEKINEFKNGYNTM